MRALAYLLLSVALEASAVSVYLAGDSTMAKYTGAGRQGWGEYLKYSVSGITVVNKAASGRSARSYTREGRFKEIYSLLKSGDYVVMAFGHNDDKTTGGRKCCSGSGSETCTETYDGVVETVLTFPKYLENAVTLFKKKNATCIISSMVARNPWSSGTYSYTAPTFVALAKTAATASNVVFIPNGAYTAAMYKRRTAAETKKLFNTADTTDNTHSSPAGATLVAKMFVKGILCSSSKLAKYVKNTSSSIEGSCISSSVARTCSTMGYTCGKLYNGNQSVSCGTCGSDEYCSGTACVPLDTISEWEQVIPDSQTNNSWQLNENTLVQIGDMSTKHVVAYSGAKSSWFSNTQNTISVQISATEGDVGFGVRLGQGTRILDRLGWTLTVNGNGTADSQFCKVLKGVESCFSTSKGLKFSTEASNNFTIRVDSNDTALNHSAWLNSEPLVSKPVSVLSKSYSDLGQIFFTTNGSKSKSFSNLTISTKTAVYVVLRSCMTAEEWNAFVVNLLGVSNESVSSRVIGENAACSKRKERRYDSAATTTFETIISDDTTTSTPSNVLAAAMDQAISIDGAAALQGVSVSSFVVAGSAVGTAAVTSAALSTGAIVGIAVGATVGGMAVLGATAGVTMAVQKHKRSDTSSGNERHVRTDIGKKTVKGGVDVMDSTADHSSITGRAPPVAVDMPNRD